MRPIPPELMDRFDKANEHFRKARMHLEEMAATDAPRDGSARTALLAAEKEFDEVKAEIDQYLKSD